MKSILITCLLLMAAPVFAEEVNRSPNSIDQVSPPTSPDPNSLLISGEVSLYSNDLFRGISVSDNQPVVQGWLGLSYLQFLNAGVFTTNTYFRVPNSQTVSNPQGDVAKRYNVYFMSAYLPIKEVTVGLQYYRYDFSDFTQMNQDEYFLEIMYKKAKVVYMYNPNYIQLDTKYQYISAEYRFDLTEKDSITPLVSTTIVEKPENVDIRDYQELRVTYTRDLDFMKVHTIFSTTNREKYYTDEKYKDTAIAFGVTVPF